LPLTLAYTFALKNGANFACNVALKKTDSKTKNDYFWGVEKNSFFVFKFNKGGGLLLTPLGSGQNNKPPLLCFLYVNYLKFVIFKFWVVQKLVMQTSTTMVFFCRRLLLHLLSLRYIEGIQQILHDTFFSFGCL